MTSPFVSAVQSNNLESLVELFKSNPSRSTIGDLLQAYETVATSDPANADAFHTTLAALQNSPNVPEVVDKSDDGSEIRESFDRVFNRSLFNAIGGLLNEEADNEVNPANKYLIASLISGSAIKTKACFSSDQVGAITVGLHFADSDYTSYLKPAEYEVKAVGALIQVLSAAKRILEIEWLYKSDLQAGVERIGGVITSASGKKVHEAATALAQGGFKDAWESKDIWALLG